MESQFLEYIKRKPRLHARTLSYGPFGANSAIEITRTKSDLPREKGGPLTLAFLRAIFSEGLLEFCAGFPAKVLSADKFIADVDGAPALDLDVIDKNLLFLGTEYVACSGIPSVEYENVCSSLSSLPSFMEKRFSSVHSIRCLAWFKLRHNAPKTERMMVEKGEGRCTNCTGAYREARKKNSKGIKKTPEERAERVSASSHVPFSTLTPNSKNVRYNNLRKVQKRDMARLTRLKGKIDEEYGVEFDGQASEELGEFVKQIPSDAVDTIIKEAGGEDDLDLADAIRTAFEADQKKNRNGSNGNRWSMVTYRIALSVYCRSPASYEALRSWGIFKLPTKSALKQFTSALLQETGPDYDFIQDQAVRYAEYAEEIGAMPDRKKPNGEGVLIFDEVKVIGKVAWNSKNGQMSGQAMDANEFASLKDIFSDIQDKAPKPKIRLGILPKATTIASFNHLAPAVTKRAQDTDDDGHCGIV